MLRPVKRRCRADLAQSERRERRARPLSERSDRDLWSQHEPAGTDDSVDRRARHVTDRLATHARTK